MVFDSRGFILTNSHVHRLWPPGWFWQTPRPFTFFTFAVNYALHGEILWPWHLTNLAIHIAAGLTLFGIIRRTLLCKRLKQRYGAVALEIAFTASLLWLVHPLQTESVTFVYQRLESLMGLFFLLVFYCFIRAQDGPRRGWWYVGAVGAFLLGVGAKEVIGVAPVLLVWYDRVFVSRSWKDVLRNNGPFYGLLGGILFVLTGIVLHFLPAYRGGGILRYEDISPMEYALSQPGVIAEYLRLSLWPQGQCFDCGWPVASTAERIVPPLLLIGSLLGLTAWATARRPAWGFLGAWFFLVLAPTSSIIPIKDLYYEHRMYLPLAAVAVAAAIGVYELMAWIGRVLGISSAHRRTILTTVFILAALSLTGVTRSRNTVYASPAIFWSDVVQKVPTRAKAYYNLAHAWEEEGQLREAIENYRRAVELDANDTDSHNNLANLLCQVLPQEAEIHYWAALSISPRRADIHGNFAGLLAAQGRMDEAVKHAETALRLAPNVARNHLNMANLLAQSRPAVAIEHYRQALVLQPAFAEAHFHLANTLALGGQIQEAIVHLREALRLQADWPEAQKNLAILLRMQADGTRGNDGPQQPVIR